MDTSSIVIHTARRLRIDKTPGVIYIIAQITLYRLYIYIYVI
jgi:hypothetical protein